MDLNCDHGSFINRGMFRSQSGSSTRVHRLKQEDDSKHKVLQSYDPKESRRSEASRSWQKLYKSKRYLRMRDIFMREHPWCAKCGDVATDLDHIIPHKGNLNLFWGTDNWQALCKSCHSAKTASGR